MGSHDDFRQENEALHERISGLSAAILRISESLDLDTVLREVVEGARALTRARSGAIATVDDAGQPLDFVSSGISAAEHRQLEAWPDGPRLFEHFRDLPAPFQLSDLPAYVRGLGFPSDPVRWKTLLGTAMRHRGVYVGSFYLSDKEGGCEFTNDDVEVLVLFASQAAAAIANARTYRNEQRIRTRLETLIDTSPVGVVVFDARTGSLTSINREAQRIVEVLCRPGQSPEELLHVVTWRRADGSEIALDRLPLIPQLTTAKKVRAEEIVLSVPDGRSVSTLINATPIHSVDGAVESMVVTMQDLTALEELERSRAEFLSMVSHELRAPLTSVKGSAATVLGATQPLEWAEVLQFFRIISDQADHMRGLIADLLDVGRIDTGTLTIVPEPAEVTALVDQARNTFLSSGARHAVSIDLPPDLPLVRADRRRIVQVLNNLFSNASQHSPSSSPIRVAAVRDAAHVAISVSDEGRGMAQQRLPHLFRKPIHGGDPERGLGSTGLGLAICKGLVEAHGGRIWAESAGEGQGMRFTFTIPVADAVTGSVREIAPSRSRAAVEGREPTRILVVDDDPLMLRYMRDVLSAAGYDPIITGDHQELSHIIRVERPQLILLDLVLAGTDGIELMEHVPELADLPVIFISAYERGETIAKALETGADDYIVKPFSATELTARIHAALRRRTGPDRCDPFVLKELTIHYQERRVTVGDREVRLTATEYELLRVLSVNAGSLLTYDDLLRQVWRLPHSGSSERVRTLVKMLRRKLGDTPAKPTYILTERGVGYRMIRPSERASREGT